MFTKLRNKIKDLTNYILKDVVKEILKDERTDTWTTPVEVFEEVERKVGVKLSSPLCNPINVIYSYYEERTKELEGFIINPKAYLYILTCRKVPKKPNQFKYIAKKLNKLDKDYHWTVGAVTTYWEQFVPYQDDLEMMESLKPHKSLVDDYWKNGGIYKEIEYVDPTNEELEEAIHDFNPRGN